jgi:hypothetical protein
MTAICDTILRRIRAKKRGWVFTPKDFTDIAPRNTIDVTLYRLVKKGIIRRLAQGIYDFPVIHPKLGALTPNPDLIAKAMVSKTGGTILPSGARAANQLGIDMQVPSKPSYLTSRSSIKKNIANYPINLRHSKYTSNHTLNPNVINTVNALRHLGKDHVSQVTIKQLDRILSNKDKVQLKKYISKFPDWLALIILQLTRK